MGLTLKTNMSFGKLGDQILKKLEAAEKDRSNFGKILARSSVRHIMRGSPVKTGQFRRNNIAKINQANIEVLPGDRGDTVTRSSIPAGEIPGEAFANAVSALSTGKILSGGDSIFITNNVPHRFIVENGGEFMRPNRLYAGARKRAALKIREGGFGKQSIPGGSKL